MGRPGAARRGNRAPREVRASGAPRVSVRPPTPLAASRHPIDGQAAEGQGSRPPVPLPARPAGRGRPRAARARVLGTPSALGRGQDVRRDARPRHEGEPGQDRPGHRAVHRELGPRTHGGRRPQHSPRGRLRDALDSRGAGEGRDQRGDRDRQEVRHEGVESIHQRRPRPDPQRAAPDALTPAVRYAVVSDIHGNLEALDAVLADAASRTDAILCLGDVVGYGADPCACIERLAEPGPEWTLGAVEVDLEPGRRYLVNVGSVGQPRDHDARAAYALWDAARGAIAIRRVPYDVDAARRKIIAGGLPQYLADRLAWGA